MSRPSDLMSQPLCPVHHTARPERWAWTSSRILGAGIGSLGHSWPKAMMEPDNKSTVDADATASLMATSGQDSDATGQANQTIAARLVSLPSGFLQPDNQP